MASIHRLRTTGQMSLTSVVIPEGTEEWEEARKLIDEMNLAHKVESDRRVAETAGARENRISKGDTVKFFCIDKFVTGDVVRVAGKYVGVLVKGITWKVQVALCKKISLAEHQITIAEEKEKQEKYKHYKFFCEECQIGLETFEKCPACGGMPAFA